MRISDWSSDVCSSDLLSSRAQRYPALKGVNLASVIADPNARTARDDTGHLYDYNTTLYIDPDSAKAMMREQEAVNWWALHKEGMKRGHHGPVLTNPGQLRGVTAGRYKLVGPFKPAPNKHPRN